jgi:hypothetical protein
LSEAELQALPYRDRLPATADQFLWGNSMFNTLGRFQGLNDEMGFIVLHSLAEYPAWQAKAALTGTAQQLVQVATGEGNMAGFRQPTASSSATPAQLKPMRARSTAALAARFHRDQPAPRSRALARCLLSAIISARRAARLRRSHSARGTSLSPCSATPSSAP